MELEPSLLSLPFLAGAGAGAGARAGCAQLLVVALSIADGVGDVWADEVKLKQVVVNLMTNAVKFTPVGGSVEVDARVVGEEAVVSVRDTGVGIATEDQERIFEAFQRGDRRASVEGPARADAVQAVRRAARRADVGGSAVRVSGRRSGFAIPVGVSR
jgi:signal transduction histidine kinase